MTISELEKKSWWNFLQDDLKELLRESLTLEEKVSSWNEKFHDYSFVVFPAAKAYEGYLKIIFLKMGFINENDYYGKHFRIGKALNPSLNTKFNQEESVYKKLLNFCKGNEIPDSLWNAWKVSRNLLFHWFPNEKNAISFSEAKERIEVILKAMDSAFKGCKIE